MSELAYGPLREADLGGLGDVLSHGFGFPAEDARGWFDRAGHGNLRVLRRGERVVGGLVEVPMGQFFGGASVPTLGVAGVGVAPDERGRGTGTRLILSCLREARARGFALSTLYPASVTFYRRAGYERAGARFAIALDPNRCHLGRDAGRGAAIAEGRGVPGELRALYAEAARAQDGYLDRGAYVWGRIEAPRGLSPKTLTVSFDDALEGYVVVANKFVEERGATRVTVVDMAARTERAASAILRLLLEYRSIAELVTWYGGTSDVFAMLLPERHVSIELRDYFVVRVVDPVRALTARGYPRGARPAKVAIVLEDASLAETSGVYTLSVEEGAGSVAVGEEAARGAPRVTMNERALAALFTGHLSPAVLAQLGWASGDDEGAQTLAEWFAGPLPSMRDMF